MGRTNRKTLQKTIPQLFTFPDYFNTSTKLGHTMSKYFVPTAWVHVARR